MLCERAEASFLYLLKCQRGFEPADGGCGPDSIDSGTLINLSACSGGGVHVFRNGLLWKTVGRWQELWGTEVRLDEESSHGLGKNVRVPQIFLENV